MNQYIKKFLNKLFIEKDLNFMVPKRELTLVLAYLGKLSLDLRTRLRRTIERDLPHCKLKAISRSKCRLNTQFRFKNSLEKKIRSRIFIVLRVVTARLLIMKKLPPLLYQSGRTHGDL